MEQSQSANTNIYKFFFWVQHFLEDNTVHEVFFVMLNGGSICKEIPNTAVLFGYI